MANVYGLDWSGTNIDPHTARSRNFDFGARYLGKFSVADRDSFWAAGLGVGPLFWERGTQDSLLGFAAGQQTAQAAIAAMLALGLSMPPVLTVDFQPTAGQLQQIADYFRGAHSVGPIAAYGNIAVLDELGNAGLISCGVQTTNQLGGHPTAPVSRFAHVLQHNDVTPAGAPTMPGLELLWGYDLEQCLRTDTPLIHWPAGSPYLSKPKPTTKPVPQSAPVTALQRAVHVTADGLWGPHTDLALGVVRTNGHSRSEQTALGTTADGVWGPKSEAAYLVTVRAIQTALGVTADGAWGPRTDAAFLAAQKRYYR